MITVWQSIKCHLIIVHVFICYHHKLEIIIIEIIIATSWLCNIYSLDRGPHFALIISLSFTRPVPQSEESDYSSVTFVRQKVIIRLIRYSAWPWMCSDNFQRHLIFWPILCNRTLTCRLPVLACALTNNRPSPVFKDVKLGHKLIDFMQWLHYHRCSLHCMHAWQLSESDPLPTLQKQIVDFLSLFLTELFNRSRLSVFKSVFAQECRNRIWIQSRWSHTDHYQIYRCSQRRWKDSFLASWIYLRACNRSSSWCAVCLSCSSFNWEQQCWKL